MGDIYGTTLGTVRIQWWNSLFGATEEFTGAGVSCYKNKTDS